MMNSNPLRHSIGTWLSFAWMLAIMLVFWMTAGLPWLTGIVDSARSVQQVLLKFFSGV